MMDILDMLDILDVFDILDILDMLDILDILDMFFKRRMMAYVVLYLIVILLFWNTLQQLCSNLTDLQTYKT